MAFSSSASPLWLEARALSGNVKMLAVTFGAKSLSCCTSCSKLNIRSVDRAHGVLKSTRLRTMMSCGVVLHLAA